MFHSAPFLAWAVPYSVPLPLWCDDTSTIRESLRQHGYVVVDFGRTVAGDLIERFEKDNGEWLLAVKTVEDQTCLVLGGEGWQPVGEET